MSVWAQAYPKNNMNIIMACAVLHNTGTMRQGPGSESLDYFSSGSCNNMADFSEMNSKINYKSIKSKT